MIRKARRTDLNSILQIYQAARSYMKRNGNEQQWGEEYPPEDMLKTDIQKGQLYVITEGGNIHGVFVFIIGEEETYQKIECGSWKNNEQYGTIHRIAGDGKMKGIFEKCLNFCKALSDNIRIDTHGANKKMQHLIESNCFEKCGIIYVEDGSSRIAYHYTKDKN